MDELRERCRQHFTAAELVEYLGVSFGVVWDALNTEVEEKYRDLVEEVCFEFDRDDNHTG